MLKQFALALILFGTAQATTYYVDSLGSDSNTGLSTTTAVASLSTALAKATGSRDTIKMSKGTYQITASMTINPGLSILGVGADKTILRCAVSANATLQPYSGFLFSLPMTTTGNTDTSFSDGNHEFAYFSIVGVDSSRLGGGFDIHGRNNIHIHDMAFKSMAFCAISVTAEERNWSFPRRWNTNVKLHDLVIDRCAHGYSWGPSSTIRLGQIRNGDVYNITINLPSAGNAIGASWNNGYHRNLKLHDMTWNGSPATGWPDHPEWGPMMGVEIANPLHGVELYNITSVNQWFSFIKPIEDDSTVADDTFLITGKPRMYVHDCSLTFPTAAGVIGIENYINRADFIGNYVQGYSMPVSSSAGNVKIYKNVFCDFGQAGVLVGGNNVTMCNNVFANMQNGLTIGGKSDDMQIMNNIFYWIQWGVNFGACRIRSDFTGTGFKFTNNLFFTALMLDGKEYLGTDAVVTRNIVGKDPKFVASGTKASPWFMLQATSPAIDSGANVGLAYSGAAPDIGAFEYGATSVWPANRSLTLSANAADFKVCPSQGFDVAGRRILFVNNGIGAGTYLFDAGKAAPEFTSKARKTMRIR